MATNRKIATSKTAVIFCTVAALTPPAAAVAAAAIVAVGAAAGAAVKSLADCTIQAGKFADEVNTLSTQTGISTEEIQKLKFAADLLDVSTETVTGSMSKLVKSMSSAKAVLLQHR